jgi:hypothetical protein
VAIAAVRPSSDISPKGPRADAGMIPFSRIVEGRTGILRSLGKRPPRADERDNFFVEPVEKPTDKQHLAVLSPPRLTLIRTPTAAAISRSSAPMFPLRPGGPTPCRPSKL